MLLLQEMDVTSSATSETSASIQTIMWEFPKISGSLLGVPIIRTVVFWGYLFGGPYIKDESI